MEHLTGRGDEKSPPSSSSHFEKVLLVDLPEWLEENDLVITEMTWQDGIPIAQAEKRACHLCTWARQVDVETPYSATPDLLHWCDNPRSIHYNTLRDGMDGTCTQFRREKWGKQGM